MFEQDRTLRTTDTARPVPKARPAFGGDLIPPIVERLAVLNRYRHVIVGVLVLAVGSALLKTASTLPMYRARAQVLIEIDRAAVDVFRQTYYEDPEPFLETQYGVLRSRDLARRVVQRIDLAQMPEFNGEGVELPAPSRAWALVERVITDPILRFLRQQHAVDPPEAGAPMSAAARDEALIDAFLSKREITPVPNSRLVEVRFHSADPELAARAANELADAYVELSQEVHLQSTTKTLTWLADETAKQKAQVETGEHRLAEYRETQDALSLDEGQDIVIARLRTLNEAVTRVESTRAQKEVLFNQVRHLDPTSEAAASFPAVANDPGVQAARARLVALETDRARLSQRYGPKHPRILKIETSIPTATSQLQTEVARAIRSLSGQYEVALAEEQTLRAGLEAQKTAAMALNRKSVAYGVLERDTLGERQVYQDLLRREKELRIESNLTMSKVRVVDHAAVPGAPFTPNARWNLLYALSFGLMAGLALAFGLNAVHDTINTPDDVSHKLNVPLLGLAPAVRGEKRPMLTGAVSGDFDEHFRAVRTALRMSVPKLPAVLVVTSAQPVEGKTTTACNLAVVLALGGARVLLVDGDMRRPSVHHAFDLDNGLGLSNVLAEQVRPGQVIRRSSEPNLHVMTAGDLPPDPSELLASEQMTNLLRQPATQTGLGSFDWVIIDTPPVLAVTDAVSLVPAVSGVVFVIRAEMTNRRVARQALDLIMAGKPGMIGAVLNRVNFRRNQYYYGRYYGYSKSYYSKTRPATKETMASEAPAGENPANEIPDARVTQERIRTPERAPRSTPSASADRKASRHPAPTAAVGRTRRAPAVFRVNETCEPPSVDPRRRAPADHPARERETTPEVTVFDTLGPRRGPLTVVQHGQWLLEVRGDLVAKRVAQVVVREGEVRGEPDGRSTQLDRVS